MAVSDTLAEVSSEAELWEFLGTPASRVITKERTRLIRDAHFFDDMIVKGHRPQLALLVDIEQIFLTHLSG
jgi:hypothetical protein